MPDDPVLSAEVPSLPQEVVLLWHGDHYLACNLEKRIDKVVTRIDGVVLPPGSAHNDPDATR